MEKKTSISSSSMNYWSRLPRELSLTILSYLPASSLCTLGQVSNMMLDLSRDTTLWRHLVVNTSNIYLKRGKYEKLVKRATMVSSFTLEDNRMNKLRPCLKTIGKVAKNLIGELNVRTLTSLSICWAVKADQELLISFGLFVNLKSLTFFPADQSDFQSEPALGLLFSKLHNLEYVKSEGFSDIDVVALATNNPNLTHLHLARASTTSTKFLTDASLKVLARNCRNITQIHLPMCRLLTDAGLAVVAMNCSKLVSVDLSGSQVSDAGVGLMVTNCQRMTRLNLNYCKFVTDAGAIKIAQKCPDLEILDLRVGKLTDLGLGVIGSSCSLLTSLNIGGNRGISVKGVREILRKCPLIKRIGIGNVNCKRDNGKKFLNSWKAFF